MSLIVCYRCTCTECGQDIYAQAHDLGAMLNEHTATHQTEECTCGVAWDVAEGPCVCESADSGSALDDCDACDTPLSECGGREAACCADCTHGNNWPDPVAAEVER